ncbi:L-type lectin-domain containing receptor kinase IV.2-like [Cryptomeria japonica]|uniref:L-type lectin-domain containing receptor kinase IV.2-like n=1 Tax=Cryptomeria japonica TaxID=3369 RepID=UPI0027D9FB1C|nr:L-type lectin-domain containing receptor kinase IV.2-like [Cryptomeria japonica]
MRSLVCISLILVGLIVIPTFTTRGADDTQVHPSISFRFDGFEQTDRLILLGRASQVQSKSAILLTNCSENSEGRMLFSTRVKMKPSKSNDTVFSFSTTFVFSLFHPPNKEGSGDGIAFVMTPSPTLSRDIINNYISLLNFTTKGNGHNHLFAVEVETFEDVEFPNPDAKYLSLDSLTENSNGTKFDPLNLSRGANIQVWIDYDHPKNKLDVAITYAGWPHPNRPIFSRNIDLSTAFTEKMYVGFSAATGSLAEGHYVLAWSFRTNGPAPSLDLTVLPSFTSHDSERKTVGKTLTIIAAASAGLFAFTLAIVWTCFRQKRYKEQEMEDWELEYWPHRFSYKELTVATKGFSEQEVLGLGGFGRVYRGVLPSSGMNVAVKCITREFTEGMKGFVAEITSMGRLQHRNLVQLRGWCRRDKQLFIVYDYMPNGSLEKLIFDNPSTVLAWSHRYNILKGVSAGLLYLHEQWEKRVVHRDIKSSNVLLDSEFNGRLGDFGLAKLYDHSENPQTTHVVGTLGYIAPELIQTGKATPSSDVFSFGVLLLEVACGRRPVDPSLEADRVVVVEWVCDLYTKDRLLDAADPKLCGEYDKEEMERVLKLGLCCSHPEAEMRLSIRHVWQILQGEVSFPSPQMPTIDGTVTIPRGLVGSHSWSLFSHASSRACHCHEVLGKSINSSKSRPNSTSLDSFRAHSSCESISFSI